LPLVLPGVEFQSFREIIHSPEKYESLHLMNTLCELILWAEKYGQVWGAVPTKMWPKFKEPQALLRQWKLASWRCCKLSRQMGCAAWDADWETVQTRQWSNPYQEALWQNESQSEQQLFRFRQYMFWLQQQPAYSEQTGWLQHQLLYGDQTAFSQPNLNLYQDFEISVH